MSESILFANLFTISFVVILVNFSFVNWMKFERFLTLSSVYSPKSLGILLNASLIGVKSTDGFYFDVFLEDITPGIFEL